MPSEDEYEKIVIQASRAALSERQTSRAEDHEAQSGVQHVYDLATLDRQTPRVTSLTIIPARDTEQPDSYSGPWLAGEQIACALVRRARGSGACTGAGTREHFSYVLKGVLMSDIEGARVFARAGSLLHTPAGIASSERACPDEDVLVLALSGSEAAFAQTQPISSTYFAGFGDRSAEPRQSTDEVIEAAQQRDARTGTRHVYNMHDDADRGAGAASGEVTLDAELRLPPGIRGKVLSGQWMHVAVLRFEPGATLNNYRRYNEQLAFVVEGELELDLEEDHLTAGRRCVLHIPAGVRHELYAPNGALVVVAQDNRTA